MRVACGCSSRAARSSRGAISSTSTPTRRKKGFLITLFTNGTLITERIADYLAEWRPFAIEITLYGRTKETYERLTGIPGSYEKCLRGIRLLLDRKLPLALKSVAVTINVHEVHEMQAFADELGVPVQVRFDDEPADRLLAEPARRAAFARRTASRSTSRIHAASTSGRSSPREFEGPANPAERADELYHCGGGVSSFAIDPQGGTEHLRAVAAGQVQSANRVACARAGMSRCAGVRARKITAPTKCTSCELKSSLCAMCPANGELENGDPENAGRFPLPRRAPARLCPRPSDTGAWGV